MRTIAFQCTIKYRYSIRQVLYITLLTPLYASNNNQKNYVEYELSLATILALGSVAQDDIPKFNLLDGDLYLSPADSCLANPSTNGYIISNLPNNDNCYWANVINRILTDDTLTIYGLVHRHFVKFYNIGEYDTSHLPQGSYLVRLVTTAGTTTKKLLIQ
ncbi:MAG: T9SS type A sorting domain-containing protein [Bacteroidales bacterium]|nr:T9SS type A sorting domain-containing protein [Bacteroidales bacterium]